MSVNMIEGLETMSEEEMDASVEASARDAEMEADNLFAQLAPRGQFGPEALNGVVMALNDVLGQMGIVEPYPGFESGERALPGDMVRALAMVIEAAQVAGVEGIALDNITDDTDLNLLAGKLKALAGNAKFAEAMSAPSEMATAEMLPVGEQGPVEAAVDDQVAMDVAEDDEALFMSRM